MRSIMGPNGWQKANPEVFWGEIAPCDHVLQIYEDDTKFIDTNLNSSVYCAPIRKAVLQKTPTNHC